MADGSGNQEGIEYSIYVHHHTEGGEEAQWEKVATTENMEKAMEEAENLIDTGKYSKVEVKQKYHDEKQNRTIDMVLKVYESRLRKPLGTVAIMLIALVCGAAAFGISYYIGMGM